MSEIRINNNTNEAIELRREIQEIAQLEKTTSDNSALERCKNNNDNPDKLAKQAYDRMYHTHNRG